jgi:hypothetical protein
MEIITKMINFATIGIGKDGYFGNKETIRSL